MFTEGQIAALAAPLSKSHVKSRNQGGRSVSYIEGWQVIAEANRIFGFDAWSRETVELKCVSEREREIGQQKSQGWGVTYIARVRVAVTNGAQGVSPILREGCGTGHGIDRDLGQAHESALKEAETDAMKRALMTFGNPFGLALYDKEQANVCDDTKAIPPQAGPAILSEPAAGEAQARLTSDIAGCVTYAELDTFIKSDGFKHRVGSLPEKHRAIVRSTYQIRAKALKPQGQAA